MSKFLEMILELRKVSGRLDKEAIVARYIDDPRVRELLVMTYNPYVTYGVKKYPKANRTGELRIDSNLGFDVFKHLFNRLASRDLTGGLAQGEIHRVRSEFTREDQEVFDIVLKRDTKSGSNVSTFNKVAKERLIPTFELSLCGKYTKDTIHKVKYPVLVQWKLDGVRDIAILDRTTGMVEHYARSGKSVEQFDDLFDDELNDLADKLFPDNVDKVVFDGEVMGSNWNTTMNAKASKNVNQAARDALKYHVFDYMSYEQWIGVKKIQQTQIETFEELSGAIDDHYEKLIYPATRLVYNYQELDAFYRSALDAGKEGIIIKIPNGVYDFDRKVWAKYKPTIDLDGTILEILPGEGRLSETMGRILIEGVDENGCAFACSVGSGFDDAQRDWFWDNRNTLIDTTVEIEAFELTAVDIKTGKYGVRFPVFKNIRKDK